MEPNAQRPQHALAALLSHELVDALKNTPNIAITGGFLARVAAELPVGEDIDVLCEIDAYGKLRTALVAAGYEASASEGSTGFREARGIADDQVMFRVKWKHETNIDIDCLVLNVVPSSELHPEVASKPPAERVATVFRKEALKFIDTYDCHIAQQLLVWEGGAPIWYQTLGAMLAVRNREPGWIDGRFTYDERRKKWDMLLF